jgi:predicted MFS family arabinose efflux permease
MATNLSYQLLVGGTPLWAARNGHGTAGAGIATAAMLTATVLAQFAVPGLAVRWGSRRLLAAGVLCMGVPAPIYPLASATTILVSLSAVRGVGFACVTATGAALVARLVPRDRHGESAGLLGIATALPGLIALPIGVQLSAAGLFPLTACLAALPLAALLVVVRLGRDTSDPLLTSQTAGRDHNVSRRAVVQAALPASLIMLIAAAASAGFSTYLPVVRSHRETAALALGLFALGAISSRWRVGRLVDSRRRTPLIMLTGAAPAGLLLIALGVMGGGWVALACVDVGAVFFGVGFGTTQNLTLVRVFASCAARFAVTASAVWNGCYDLGGALGSGVIGRLALLVGLGLAGLFAVLGGVLATVPVVAFRWLDRGRRPADLGGRTAG